jgi:hypothetical protein
MASQDVNEYSLGEIVTKPAVLSGVETKISKQAPRVCTMEIVLVDWSGCEGFSESFMNIT